MKRHLRNVLTAVSLLLCVKVLMLWAGSPWGFGRDDEHRVIIFGDAYFVASRAGRAPDDAPTRRRLGPRH